MNILIIGGCGYIGSALRRHLTNLDSSLTRIHIDTVDLEWFGAPLVSTYRLDYGTLIPKEMNDYDVIIVAAAHSSVSMCQQDPYGAFENNVGNFVRLLRGIESFKTNRPALLYASSSCVYTGLTWKCSEQDELTSPVDHLTLTKQTIDHYAMQSDVEFYGLRFGSVNGWSPNLRGDLMINAMTRDAITEGVVRVSNPEMHRPILGMNDLCRAVETILNSGKDRRGLYNVASFNETIRDIGHRVATRQNAKLQVCGTPGGYDFQMSSAKFCTAFDFSFRDTVESIVEDLVDHNVNCQTARLRNKNMEYKL